VIGLDGFRCGPDGFPDWSDSFSDWPGSLSCLDQSGFYLILKLKYYRSLF
jgi:hypothetical protein